MHVFFFLLFCLNTAQGPSPVSGSRPHGHAGHGPPHGHAPTAARHARARSGVGGATFCQWCCVLCGGCSSPVVLWKQEGVPHGVCALRARVKQRRKECESE